MSFLDRIKRAGRALLTEATPPGAYGLLEEDIGWSRLGQARRDISQAAHDEMLRQAAVFYDRNPLGKWVLEMTRDLICAEGLEITADDDDAKELLDKFWTHPINNWDLNLPSMVLEVGLWGEACYPVFLPESGSGIAVLGLVDSADIKEVRHDPDNCAVPIGVVLKDRGEREGAKLRVIYSQPDTELFAPAAIRMRAEEFTHGECFWYKINTVRAATRGRSDLYAIGDWLDGYEQYLYNTLDRTGFLNAFTWDVTLENMDAGQIRQWLRDNPVPRPGSWFAHNERVKLEPKTPSLGSADTSQNARIFRNHALGALAFPEHWFGGGGDVNRATSENMDVPTFKRYLARQRTIRHLIETILDYQLRLGAQGGLVSLESTYTLNMPQMVTEDIPGIAAALVQLTGAAQIAADNGWIGHDVAARLFAKLAERTGVEIDLSHLETPEGQADARFTTSDYRRQRTEPDAQ